MKKFEEMKTRAQDNKYVTEVLNNADINVETLPPTERLKVVAYREIAQAISNDTHIAVLQCNYECTKHPDAHPFDLIRFVEKEKHQNALTNIYISIKGNKVYCKLTVSAHKAYQQALAKAGYDTVKHCKTVAMDKIASEIKTLYALFNGINKK